jgi:type IV pilus assembly protein PilB
MSAKLSLKEQLINILTQSQVLKPDQIEKALQIQKEKGGRLGTILVSLGYLREEDFLAALSKSLHIPPINLARLKIDPQIIASTVPEEVARRYGLIPISIIGNNLTVVVSDPLNVFAIDDIRTITGYKIRTAISTKNRLTPQLINTTEKIPSR